MINISPEYKNDLSVKSKIYNSSVESIQSKENANLKNIDEKMENKYCDNIQVTKMDEKEIQYRKGLEAFHNVLNSLSPPERYEMINAFDSFRLGIKDNNFLDPNCTDGFSYLNFVEKMINHFSNIPESQKEGYPNCLKYCKLFKEELIKLNCN